MVSLLCRKGAGQTPNLKRMKSGNTEMLGRSIIDNITVRYFAVQNFSPAPKGTGRKEKKRSKRSAAESRKKFNRHNIYFRN